MRPRVYFKSGIYSIGCIFCIAIVLGSFDFIIEFNSDQEQYLEEILEPIIMVCFSVFLISGAVLWYWAFAAFKEEGELHNPINLLILLSFNLLAGYFFYYYRVIKRENRGHI